MSFVNVKIPREEANALEALNYEAQSRKQVIAFCIEQGIDISSEQFKRYQHEYTEFFVRWERAKLALEEEHLSCYPNRRRWWLLGATSEVRLELVDA